ncbi:hypothetical protein ZWY2020_021494 [Hordeum vulgare]|nr:hypothetical protein ZWY2020_021494 [Hordeum vulgare]
MKLLPFLLRVTAGASIPPGAGTPSSSARRRRRPLPSVLVAASRSCCPRPVRSRWPLGSRFCCVEGFCWSTGEMDAPIHQLFGRT